MVSWSVVCDAVRVLRQGPASGVLCWANGHRDPRQDLVSIVDAQARDLIAQPLGLFGRRLEAAVGQKEH
jgi:hypothetical protein